MQFAGSHTERSNRNRDMCSILPVGRAGSMVGFSQELTCSQVNPLVPSETLYPQLLYDSSNVQPPKEREKNRSKFTGDTHFHEQFGVLSPCTIKQTRTHAPCITASELKVSIYNWYRIRWTDITDVAVKVTTLKISVLIELVPPAVTDDDSRCV